jgi:hypothetical protein
MIALNLQDALIARFQEIFSNYFLPAKGGEEKNIKVFSQYLP